MFINSWKYSLNLGQAVITWLIWQFVTIYWQNNIVSFFCCYVAFFVLNLSTQHIFMSPGFHFMHNNISMYPFGQLRLHFECDLRWYSLRSNFSIKVILRIKVNVFTFFTFKIRSKCALFFTDKCYTICQSVPCRPPKLSSSCVHAVDVSHSLAKCFQSQLNQWRVSSVPFLFRFPFQLHCELVSSGVISQSVQNILS